MCTNFRCVVRDPLNHIHNSHFSCSIFKYNLDSELALLRFPLPTVYEAFVKETLVKHTGNVQNG